MRHHPEHFTISREELSALVEMADMCCRKTDIQCYNGCPIQNLGDNNPCWIAQLKDYLKGGETE